MKPIGRRRLRRLTLIQDLEAHVGAAVVGGEQQVQEVGAAEQELGHLGPVEGANQRGEQVGPVVHLKEVVTQFRLEPRRGRTDGRGGRGGNVVFKTIGERASAW